MAINSYYKRIIAREVSVISRYLGCMIRWRPRRQESPEVIQNIQCNVKVAASEFSEIEKHCQSHAGSIGVLIDGGFNFSYDIQGDLFELKKTLKRNSRIFLIAYNPYIAWLYRLGNKLGIRKDDVPTTFITEVDLRALAEISGFEIVKMKPLANFPIWLFGLDRVLNILLASIPLVRRFSLAYLVVLRPILAEALRPSLTVLIPARNERGNIQPALDRMPDLECDLEVLFVEGNSTDGTWEEIQAAIRRRNYPFQVRALKQAGKGKADAVRTGFAQASHSVLTVLDADLTMPPELLGRFYEAYVQGHADFINGSRLIYPMEGEAMRFLNWLGNIFFAKALSFVLGVKLGDSLCGTKLMSRSDYIRFTSWRRDFGEFDPFGDFEMLFPAAELGLGMVDIPIRYRARTYGSTNISRFRDGFVLLRMTLLGLWKVKWGLGRRSQ